MKWKGLKQAVELWQAFWNWFVCSWRLFLLKPFAALTSWMAPRIPDSPGLARRLWLVAAYGVLLCGRAIAGSDRQLVKPWEAGW